MKIQELEEKELDLEELDNSESNYLADNILKKRFNDVRENNKLYRKSLLNIGIDAIWHICDEIFILAQKN